MSSRNRRASFLWSVPLSVTLLSVLVAGCRVPSQAQPDPGQVTLRVPAALPTSFAQYYHAVPVAVTPHAPGYALPLDLLHTDNPGLAGDLSDAQTALLRQNGFVVLDAQAGDDLAEAYKSLKASGDPVWITSDSVLHLYHLQFDQTLEEVEEQKLSPALQSLSTTLLADSLALYNASDGDLKAAAGRNAVYFAVALTELTGTAPALPADLAALAAQETALIEAHEGFATSPLFYYKEDYSQYVPRGHYTHSELLKRYFKTMMWYGRLGFLLKGTDLGDDALLTKEQAQQQTLQAALIAAQLYAQPAAGQPSLAQAWEQIYSVTAFFVGFADDLTPLQYAQQISAVAGAAFTWTQLADPQTLEKLRERLAALPPPLIYGGTGRMAAQPPFTPEELGKALVATQGMRFLGQRYTPDSFMMQQLIVPAVGAYQGQGQPFTLEMTQTGPARCFARGLDIMSVLGSSRAGQILQQEGDTAYQGYDAQVQKLQAQFAALPPEQWSQTLYWGWLRMLEPLLQPLGEGYPQFMRTGAWQDRQLATALASWAQLRHDTILYVKQPYGMVTMAMPRPIPQIPSRGYVEPLPELYARLIALTQATREGLSAMKMLPATVGTRLQGTADLFQKLLAISSAELSGQALSDAQYDYIRNYGMTIEDLTSAMDEQSTRTTVVADVQTDPNTSQVLEEGTGYLRPLVAAFSDDQGKVHLGRGAMLSYYEFKQPMANRLTDEAWRTMLMNTPPAPAPWIAAFVVK
jgi:hypothetical protein